MHIEIVHHIDKEKNSLHLEVDYETLFYIRSCYDHTNMITSCILFILYYTVLSYV